MIHFVPPHVEKVTAKVPELLRQVDVVLGNLEDAIPADAKAGGARRLHRHGARRSTSARPACGRGSTRSTRPGRSTTSPRSSPRSATSSTSSCCRRSKAPGTSTISTSCWRSSKPGMRSSKPILIHAILETAQGVNNVEAIAAASPRMHGMSLGPADLAASRGMKTTRVGGGHPDYAVLADAKDGATRGRNSSRTSGTTRRPRWWTPARPPASSRSTDRSAISPIRTAARRSSATPS